MKKSVPHTKWINNDDRDQAMWISAQRSKRGLVGSLFESYLNGERENDYEYLKNQLRLMENCWRAEQSRKSKATITIYPSTQKQIQNFCKKQKIPPARLIDNLTKTLKTSDAYEIRRESIARITVVSRLQNARHALKIIEKELKDVKAKEESNDSLSKQEGSEKNPVSISTTKEFELLESFFKDVESLTQQMA